MIPSGTKLSKGTEVIIKQKSEIVNICLRDGYVYHPEGAWYETPGEELTFGTVTERFCGLKGVVITQDFVDDVKVKFGEETLWFRRKWVDVVSTNMFGRSFQFGSSHTTQHKRPTINLGNI